MGLVSLVADVVLLVGKLAGGVFAGSSALLADAVHTASDLISDVATLWFVRIGEQPPDAKHPYGHGRFETVGMVLLAGLLLVTAAGIAIEAVGDFDGAAAPGSLALWVAAGSIVVKEALYHYTIRAGRRLRSRLLQANAWHHRSDSLSSVAVLAGVAGARAGFPILDPVASVVVALLIGKMGVDVAREALEELTDTTLAASDLERLQAAILQVPGVRDVHDLRARRMGRELLVDLHLQVAPLTTVSDGHQTAERVRYRLLELAPEISEVLVHVDSEPDPVEPIPPGRPADQIEAEVRQAATGVEGIDGVAHVTTHYVAGQAHVVVDILVGGDLSVRQAAARAEALRVALADVAGIVAVEVHLELGPFMQGDDQNQWRLEAEPPTGA